MDLLTVTLRGFATGSLRFRGAGRRSVAETLAHPQGSQLALRIVRCEFY